MKSQEIQFWGHPNSDDDIRAIAPGQFRFAKHLRSGSAEGANQFARESYPGNAVLTNGGLPAGTNLFVGGCKYVESRALMLFYYNSNGDHTIWLLNTTNSTFTKVAQGSFLNLVSTSRVLHADVINGVLYWTTGRFSSFLNYNFDPPHQIDIAEAIKFTLGLPSKYTVLDRRAIDFVKYPPVFGPEIAYATDVTQKANLLYGKLYKFRYRYIYINNEISAFSPISRLGLPPTAQYVRGRNWVQTQDDNNLVVSLDSGPAIVKAIEVAVSVNDGPWYLFSQIDKAEQGIANDVTTTATYTGNEAVIALEIPIRNYDRVPLTSVCQSPLPNRRMSFTHYREGFDLVTPEITLEAVPIEIRKQNFRITNVGYFWSSGAGRSYITIGSAAVPGYSDVFVNVGDTFNFVLGGAVTDQTITYAITEQDHIDIYAEATATLRITKLLEILATYISSIVGSPGSATTLGGGVAYEWALQIFVATSIKSNPTSRLDNVNAGLFKGIIHEYGVQYYDRANRDATVQTLPAMNLYVPTEVEQDRSDFYDPNSPYFVRCRALVSHVPPDSGTHYQFVHRRIPVLGFQERTAVKIVPDPSVLGNLRISLDPYWLNVVGAQVPFMPQKGDIVRVIRRAATNGVTAMYGDYPDTYVELEVDYYFPAGGTTNLGFITESISVEQFDYTSILGGDTGLVLQIYRRAKLDENAPWREIGEEYEVLDSCQTTRYHQGSEITGTATDLSTGLFTFTLTDAFVDQPGANFEYLIGRPFTIDADTPWSGVILDVVFDQPTQLNTVTASTAYAGTDTSAAVSVDLDQNYDDFVAIAYNNLLGGTFSPGDTITDSVTGATATVIFDDGVSALWAYLTTPELAFGVGNPFDNGTGVSADVVTATVTDLGAIVDMAYGDVYTRTRILSTGYSADNTTGYYPIDDFSFSDFYVSNFNSDGRLAAENVDARMIVQKATTIHGGSYIDNSRTNNLTRFDPEIAEAVLAMDESYGPVNRTVVVGDTLKCLQDMKENSVYIERTPAVGPDGNLALVFTDRTYGGWRAMESDFGCSDPASVQVIGGMLLYYDNINGVVVMSVENGPHDICGGDYKYRVRILQFKSALQTITRGNADVTSFVDEANREYGLTLYNKITGGSMQGLVFRYDKRMWDHELSYAVSNALNLGTYLISAAPLGAPVYRHGTGAQNTFFGIVYASQIAFAFNGDRDLLKKLRALGLKTDQLWTVSSVATEANLNYPAMDSEILPQQWEALEGYLWAQFLNDKNNVVPEIPSLATTQLALINGRQLKGYGALLTMSYTPGNKVKLWAAKVNYELLEPEM